MDGIMWLLESLIGAVGDEGGEGLALRSQGNELLFAPRGGKPCRWIQITEFVVDYEGEEEVEAKATAQPFPRRRDQ